MVQEQVSHAISRSERPRWRVLPPEIIHIIMEMLRTDREALSACSLVSREFTFAALYNLGRHITINTVRRLRECATIISKGSAFQHVRSLDLGITTARQIRERDWDDYLIVLEAFARRRALTHLWLSDVSFPFIRPKKQEAVKNVIAALTATVDELGLYSCHFSCYAEMISLVRAFPLCTSLYVRDCVTLETPQPDMFAGLPQHTLHINDLKLASSSNRRFLIDFSNLIKDAALDISSLSDFSCDMSTADEADRTVATAVASPIERFRLICNEPGGFRGMSRLSEDPHDSLILIAPSQFWKTRQ